MQCVLCCILRWRLVYWSRSCDKTKTKALKICLEAASRRGTASRHHITASEWIKQTNENYVPDESLTTINWEIKTSEVEVFRRTEAHRTQYYTYNYAVNNNWFTKWRQQIASVFTSAWICSFELDVFFSFIRNSEKRTIVPQQSSRDVTRTTKTNDRVAKPAGTMQRRDTNWYKLYEKLSHHI